MRKPLVATKSVAICDLTAAAPKYKAAAPLRHARMHLNLVLLPDRTVMATGGAAVQEKKVHAALEAELFDPKTGKWRRGAKSRVPRLYHSVALLMPDGKVDHRRLEPQARRRGVPDRGLLAAVPVQGPAAAAHARARPRQYGASLRRRRRTRPRLREVNLSGPRPPPTRRTWSSGCSTCRSRSRAGRAIDLTLPTEPNLAPPGWYMVVRGRRSRRALSGTLAASGLRLPPTATSSTA